MFLDNLDSYFCDTQIDLIAVVGSNWNFVELTQAWVETLGYDLEELRSYSTTDLIHPDDLEDTIKVSVSADKIINYINRYKHKSGAWIWLKWRTSKIDDGLYFCFAEDITESKHQNLKLQEANKRFEDIVESTDSLTYEVDKDFNFLYLPEQVYSLIGVHASDLIGKSGLSMFLPEDREKWSPMISEIKKNLPIINDFEYRGVCKDGSVRYQKLFAKPFFDSDGHFMGYRGTSTNITKSKLDKIELDKERSKTIHASKLSSLGEMAGSIAHEINNPLNIISGFASMIELEIQNNSPSFESIEKNVNDIYKTVDRIAKIVHGMKKFSISPGNEPLVGVFLHDIFEGTLLMCAARFKSNKVKFVLEDIPNDLFVYCRSVEVSQVLLNLLNNAYDSVLKVDSNRWIEVKIVRKSNKVLIKVFDSGAAVDKKIKDKIFEPFFTTKDIGQGIGLGLSISRDIMIKNNGDLRLEYREKISYFEIELDEFLPEIDGCFND
jgi:PAS domain S-box-containing protein